MVWVYVCMPVTCASMHCHERGGACICINQFLCTLTAHKHCLFGTMISLHPVAPCESPLYKALTPQPCLPPSQVYSLLEQLHLQALLDGDGDGDASTMGGEGAKTALKLTGEPGLFTLTQVRLEVRGMCGFAGGGLARGLGCCMR